MVFKFSHLINYFRALGFGVFKNNEKRSVKLSLFVYDNNVLIFKLYLIMFASHNTIFQEIPSHPLNDKTLANCLKSRDLLEEEFKVSNQLTIFHLPKPIFFRACFYELIGYSFARS